MKKFKLNSTSLAALGIFAYVACFVITAIQSTEPFVKVVEKTLPKTVMLQINTKKDEYLCSGVFISAEGHILTCNHCVDDKNITAIIVNTYSGYSYFGEVLYKDKSKDLAL